MWPRDPCGLTAFKWQFKSPILFALSNPLTSFIHIVCLKKGYLGKKKKKKLVNLCSVDLPFFLKDPNCTFIPRKINVMQKFKV